MYEAYGFAAENMDRRQLLKSVCVGTTGIAATAIACNLQSWVLAAQQGGKVHWGYIGKEGAENWGKCQLDSISGASGNFYGSNPAICPIISHER